MSIVEAIANYMVYRETGIGNVVLDVTANRVVEHPRPQ